MFGMQGTGSLEPVPHFASDPTVLHNKGNWLMMRGFPLRNRGTLLYYSSSILIKQTQKLLIKIKQIVQRIIERFAQFLQIFEWRCCDNTTDVRHR